MKGLNFRTGAVSSQRERTSKKIKRPCLVEPKARQRILSAGPLPKYKKRLRPFLAWKNPLRANYYYMKNAKGRCKIGAERSAHGIRWNYYMRSGKRIPRIAPPIFSRSLIFSSGILRSMAVERQKPAVMADMETSTSKAVREKNSVDFLRLEMHAAPIRPQSTSPREGKGSETIAKVIPISIHPAHSPKQARVHQPTAARTRTYRLKRTLMWSSVSTKSDNPTSTDRRIVSLSTKRASHTQPKDRTTAWTEERKMRRTAEAKKADRQRGKQRSSASSVKTAKAGQRGNASISAGAPRAQDTSAIALQPTKTAQHVGYIPSPERKRTAQLKVAQTDPESPR